jgi:hypothetical protein
VRAVLRGQADGIQEFAKQLLAASELLYRVDLDGISGKDDACLRK